nr:hypothetical protein [Pseudomonas sp. P42]
MLSESTHAPIRLCHCGEVSFSLTSAHPYPYQRCYCSICRKIQFERYPEESIAQWHERLGLTQ